MTDKQPEALRLADALESDFDPDWMYELGYNQIAAELRRLHAEVEKKSKPLTDEEIVDIWADVSIDYDDQINIIEMARAIERAHGIGGEA